MLASSIFGATSNHSIQPAFPLESSFFRYDAAGNRTQIPVSQQFFIDDFAATADGKLLVSGFGGGLSGVISIDPSTGAARSFGALAAGANTSYLAVGSIDVKLPDVAFSSLQWKQNLAGKWRVELDYTVKDAPLPTDGTYNLYWAKNGTKLSGPLLTGDNKLVKNVGPGSAFKTGD